ncbi:MAG: carboxypeptidase regulatory-like domain-containing protein [Prevotellaceae bacterium]|nr:carboxypeptidase regulatory-like domain-containing protein [Prevotellaceae bacterium]
MIITGAYAQNVKFEHNNFPGREDELKKALADIYQGEKFLFEAETMLFGKGVDVRHMAKAMDMVSKGLVYFLKANSFNPQSGQLNYTIGKSYLYIGKCAKALEFLQKALLFDEKGFKDVHFLIGQAHQQMGAFEQAIESYSIAARNYGNEAEMSDVISKKIKECRYAQELVSDAVDVRVESVGTAMNTDGAEYLPVVTGGDEILFFQRFSAGKNRLYAAERSSGGWRTAVETNQSFLLPEKETLTELTLVDKSGTPALTRWFSVNIGSQQQMGQGYYESLATLSKSYDKPIAFFSSNRYDGLGGFDVFMTQRDKKGRWERSHNFSEINTSSDEFGVALHPTSKILYFSSNGHQTMGGYDIFKTEYDGRQWGKPENLGYPINSAADDIIYSVSDDGNRLYFSSNRISGKGGYDIYMVNFMPGVLPVRKSTPAAVNVSAEAIGTISSGGESAITVSDLFSTDPEVISSIVAKYPAAMHGFISDNQTYMPLAVNLRLLDKSNNAEEVIETDNKGIFYATLSAGGSYRVTIEAPGYRPYTEDFRVSDEVGQKLTKNIGLSPLNVIDHVKTVADAVTERIEPAVPAAAPETESEYEDVVVLMPVVDTEEQSQEAEYPVAVTGLVSDNFTLAPVSAKIKLAVKDSDDERIVESNSKGLVKFNLAAGKTYVLTATADGYEEYTEEFVTQDRDQQLSKTFKLQSIAPPVAVAEVIPDVDSEPVSTIVELTPVPVLEEVPEDEPRRPTESRDFTLTAEDIAAQQTLEEENVSYEEDIVVLTPVVPLYESPDSILENREYPVDLKVYVSDEKTLQPLAVSVKLTVKDTEIENSLATDDKGMLGVTIASGNTYRLMIESPGYLTAEEVFEVAKGPGQVLTHNITLSPIEPEVTPEQVVAEVIPEPEIIEQPEIIEEPVVEPLPEPVIEEPAVTPEPEVEPVPEPVIEEPAVTPEPVVEPVPEPVIEEPAVTPEPEVEPVPEPVIEESAVTPEPKVELVPEPVIEEPAVTPEPVVEKPVVKPEPKPEPVVKLEPKPEPKPVVEKTKPAAVESSAPALVALSGAVVGIDTKKPVTDVTVTLTDVTRGITEEVKVNEQGKFNVNTVAGSKYSVKIKAEGYQTVVQDIESSPKSKKIDVPVKLTPVTGTFVANVYFDFDRAALNEKAEQTLQQVIALLKQGGKVYLTGYTDNLGGHGYNKRLSERRVEVVTAYLHAHGITSEEITTSWKGLSDPVETNFTQSGRKLNNRVEIWTK